MCLKFESGYVRVRVRVRVCVCVCVREREIERGIFFGDGQISERATSRERDREKLQSQKTDLRRIKVCYFLTMKRLKLKEAEGLVSAPIIMQARYQFHQHFMYEFFVRTTFRQLLSSNM